MAKAKSEPVAFEAEPEFLGEEPAAAPVADPRDAEIARLKAEVEALKASPAAAALTGGRFVVAIKDGPKACVECNPGEHPYDAFMRLTGVQGSIHAPEIAKAPNDAPLGHHRPDGTIQPFAA